MRIVTEEIRAYFLGGRVVERRVYGKPEVLKLGDRKLKRTSDFVNGARVYRE